MEIWSDAAARFWGLPRQEKEEKGRPDKRFSAPEWESNPFYQTLKESYLLASEFLLKEAKETDGQDTDEQRRLKFHLRQFVDAMAPVNFLLTNPAALRRIAETGGTSLAEGTRNLLADLREGRLSMTDTTRSEEHTSELQSRQYLVCRLLLAKKTESGSLPPGLRTVRSGVSRARPIPSRLLRRRLDLETGRAHV